MPIYIARTCCLHDAREMHICKAVHLYTQMYVSVVLLFDMFIIIINFVTVVLCVVNKGKIKTKIKGKINSTLD